MFRLCLLQFKTVQFNSSRAVQCRVQSTTARAATTSNRVRGFGDSFTLLLTSNKTLTPQKVE